ncbi:hypothetical protein GPL17_16695 [Bradyrhizobium yuanmingense]|uniref:hypothetical protein n=1 Tax=Bradyrhizobium yuanmingense TaxID=108015 RepID=UPI0012F848FA|nr:hypothetical protein [Bradyrhizobium yuanmingense]MVT52123.1 hypothetical protein [Bradyrhizobium yuanmingense]
MGKSKGPRVKVKAAEVEQEPIAPSVPHPAIAGTAKIWSVLIAIGSVGGFISLVEKAWTVAVGETKPVIRPLNLSADPFSLPFVIKNPSSIFTMANSTWICGIESAGGGPGAGEMANLGIAYGKATDIPPGQSLLARCPVGGAGGADATITPLVRYKTIGVAREYKDAAFTWLAKANPPQWTEGKPLK